MLFVYMVETLMQVAHTCSRVEIAFCMFMPSSLRVNTKNNHGISIEPVVVESWELLFLSCFRR